MNGQAVPKPGQAAATDVKQRSTSALGQEGGADVGVQLPAAERDPVVEPSNNSIIDEGGEHGVAAKDAGGFKGELLADEDPLHATMQIKLVDLFLEVGPRHGVASDRDVIPSRSQG